MFDKSDKYAIYMEGALDTDYGKMGYGVMRYAEQPIVCVIDSKFANKTVREAVGQPFDFQVVGTVEEAKALGAKVLVLGTAPSGGKFPDEWVAPVKSALQLGMSLINGLHDGLQERFSDLITDPTQKIWDIRKPSFRPQIGMARAAALDNKRILMVGTDMAAGKMTVGLELYKWLQNKNANPGFVATGQIGISIMGDGIPLDAFIVDHAAGAVETKVMEQKDKDIVIVEGQGSLLHPGSTATLPLMRGACPTHLILCHRAWMETLRKPTSVKIPDLKKFIELNEALCHVAGSLTQAKCIGVGLNTYGMSEQDALDSIKRIEEHTGLPATDVIRYGVEKLGNKLLEE